MSKASKSNKTTSPQTNAKGLPCVDTVLQRNSNGYNSLCLHPGEAFCKNAGTNKEFSFGIIDDNEFVFWSMGNKVWSYCDTVSMVCIGEDQGPSIQDVVTYLHLYKIPQAEGTIAELSCSSNKKLIITKSGKSTKDSKELAIHIEDEMTIDNTHLVSLKLHNEKILTISFDETLIGSSSYDEDRCSWLKDSPCTSENSIFIPKDTANYLTVNDLVTGSFPAGFFDGDATIEITRVSNEDDIESTKLFFQTASLYNLIVTADYHIKITSDTVPSTLKYAHFYISLLQESVDSVSATDRIEFFVQIEQSSVVEDILTRTYVMVNSELNLDTRIITVWIPSFAFLPNKDGGFSTDIFLASTPGTDLISSNPAGTSRHLRSIATTQRQSVGIESPPTCRGISIRCPLNNCDTVSAHFELQRVHTESKAIKPHLGVDYAASEGDNVMAAAFGIIESIDTQIDEDVDYGYGLYLILRHDDGGATLYAHLSSVSVQVGDSVQEGQVIALVGQSGSVSDVHLHFEYSPSGRLFDNKGRIDPHPCVAAVQSGSIVVGDGGSAPDDSFKVLINGGTLDEEIILGTTEVGARKNNFAISGLRPGTYTLIIEVDVAPDYTPTFQVFLDNGVTFEDGTTSRHYYDWKGDYSSFKYKGDRLSWIIIIPDNEKFNGLECKDEWDNLGTCMFTSKCENNYQSDWVHLPGYCPDFPDPNVQCCLSAFKCSSIGGTCTDVSSTSCPNGHSQVDGLCPGDMDIKCCVKNDICANEVEGECMDKATCLSSGKLHTTTFCPSTDDVCCVNAPSCTWYDTTHDIKHTGICAQNSDSCESLFLGENKHGIPTPGGSDCVIGDAPVCCIPKEDISPCKNENNEGSCELKSDCNIYEDHLMWIVDNSQCPYPAGCCSPVPPPPCVPESVSPVREFTFTSNLVDDGFFSDDIWTSQVMKISVQCFECDGTVYPRLAENVKDTIQKVGRLDESSVELKRSNSINENSELVISWMGTAWEGNWKSDEEKKIGTEALKAVSDMNSQVGLGVSVAESFAVGAGIAAGVSDHVKAAISSSRTLQTIPVVGLVASAGFIWADQLDTELYWMFRRTVNFQCKDNEPYAQEVHGTLGGNSMLKLPSFETFYSDDSSVKTEFSSQDYQGLSVPKYELPSGVSSGFGAISTFAVDTLLMQKGFIFGSDILEHHRVMIALRCSDEGKMNVAGLLPPVSLHKKSLFRIYVEGLQRRSSPSMSNIIRSSDDTTVTFFTSALVTDADLNGSSYFFSVYSLSTFASTLTVIGITGSVPSGGTTLVITAAGLTLGAVATLLADKYYDTEYHFAYTRRFSATCVRQNDGSFAVEREKERNICITLKDTRDEDRYFVRVDNLCKEIIFSCKIYI